MRDTIRQLRRLLEIAGVAFFLLTIFATAGFPETIVNHEDHGILPQPMISEEGELFETVVRFQENGEQFLYASTPAEGSGAFMTEAIYWIAPDGAIHPIIFEHAGRAFENQMIEGELLLTGGPGILFTNGRLRFEFFIAGEEDSHCCPSAGRISGTYKITGEDNFDSMSKEYHTTFKLVVDTYDRYKKDIISSDLFSKYTNETEFITEGEDRL